MWLPRTSRFCACPYIVCGLDILVQEIGQPMTYMFVPVRLSCSLHFSCRYMNDQNMSYLVLYNCNWNTIIRFIQEELNIWMDCKKNLACLKRALSSKIFILFTQILFYSYICHFIRKKFTSLSGICRKTFFASSWFNIIFTSCLKIIFKNMFCYDLHYQYFMICSTYACVMFGGAM